MTAITKRDWTVFVRCSMMVPVSSIFLQENGFSPLPQRAFFWPFSALAPPSVAPHACLAIDTTFLPVFFTRLNTVSHHEK
jgi:hypothetical protein